MTGQARRILPVLDQQRSGMRNDGVERERVRDRGSSRLAPRR